MSDGKLKCGVAGVGYLGQHHARIYSELPEVELAGVYEVDDARAEEMIARRLARDPDLWVVEIEDPEGRHSLDEPVV